MLVLDATVALAASGRDDGFDELEDDLVAPPLMWSEALSVLHEMLWRRELDPADAVETRLRLEGSRVSRRSPRGLGARAWAVADSFGWAKTYEAEYVALADLLKCRLVTLDARLRRRTGQLGFVIGPEEL